MSIVLDRIAKVMAPTFSAVSALLAKLFRRAAVPIIRAPMMDAQIAAGPSTLSPAIAVEAPLPSKTPKRRARTATQVAPNTETLSDLLDGLESSFETMQIPSIKGNWLPKSDIRALHKLGVYVPSPWLLEHMQNPSLPAALALPMMASCFLSSTKVVDDVVSPRFAFAIKAPRLPESVEQIRGVAYRFGYCVELTETERDLNSPPRMFWAWSWVVVRPDGSIALPHELRPVVHQINHRRMQAHHGRSGGCRSSSFTTRQWVIPTAFTTEPGRHDQAEYENYLLCVFRQLLLWWTSRDERWSVGVRKGDKRATFSIAKEQTAGYFADRDKTAAVDGTAKKIIHFVREHERANGSVVRAHVRGLREFDWRSFHCIVTAPTLNGMLSTNAPLVPVELSSHDDDIGTLTSEQAAVLLADYEDAPVVRSGRPAKQMAAA